MVIASWILAIVGVLGVSGTVVAFIFFPAIAAPILAKIVQVVLACKACLVVAALVAVAVGSFWYGREGQYEKGHTAAIAEIASEDASALKAATDKRGVWQECRGRNGAWNQSTGVCK